MWDDSPAGVSVSGEVFGFSKGKKTGVYGPHFGATLEESGNAEFIHLFIYLFIYLFIIKIYNKEQRAGLYVTAGEKWLPL